MTANNRVLHSRRNRVFVTDYQGVTAVRKEYVLGDQQREASILLRLAASGVAAPRLLTQGAGWVVLEYLPGQPLCEYLQDCEQQGRDGQTVIAPLWQWLDAYWRAVGEARGDVNLRNFFWQAEPERLVGVDFEGEAEGCPLTDAARLLAYALTYEPPFTPWKQQWIRAAARGSLVLGRWTKAELNEAFRQELHALTERRGPVPPASFCEFWEKGL